MIRLCANLSKKMPIPGQPFSSQQFGASLEVEVGDSDDPDRLKARMKELYRLLDAAIAEQFQSAATPEAPAVAPAAALANAGPGRNGDASPGPNSAKASAGRTRPVRATAAQVRAIRAIAQSHGLSLADELAAYRVQDPAELTIKDASRLIDGLKARTNGHGTQR
ncbi:MAG: hypothetical protein AMXMBFR7_52660 [Planctomycetota bacterium]